MFRQSGANYRFTVLADGKHPTNVSVGDPPTFGDALATISRHHSGPAPEVAPLRGYDQLEIMAVDSSGGDPVASKNPRYRFFIDRSVAGQGDGSEVFPWPNLETALGELGRRHAAGTMRLEPREHLRVSVREVFSTTPIDRRKQRTETAAKALLFIMTLVLVVPVLVILGYLSMRAWPVLSPSFIFQNPTNNMTAGGIWAPLVGTFYLVFISLLAAAPIGILAGVYLNEYARDNWLTRVVNLAVVNLAGVPSIVHGLFGVGAFVMFARMGESVLAASCTLAVMTLPVIIASTKEALASVPMSFREACWNMGASRWQTIRTIVLPNSVAGILTGVILQVSRAAGETAPILFTGAAFYVNTPNHGLGYVFPYRLTDSCMALSYHLLTVMTQVKGATAQQIASDQALPLEDLQYGTAFVLIAVVLLFNSMSIALRVYLRSRKKW